MGRPSTVDKSTLVLAFPDKKRCKCLLCDKTLAYLTGNIRRHYKTNHPQTVIKNFTPNMRTKNPNKLMEIADQSHDDDDDSLSQRSNEQFESVYIGKSEASDEHFSKPDTKDFLLGISNCETMMATTSNQSNPKAKHMLSPSSATSYVGSDDADDAYYLRYLANKFSKYSKRTKNTLQFHINSILYKADMGDFDKTENALATDTNLT